MRSPVSATCIAAIVKLLSGGVPLTRKGHDYVKWRRQNSAIRLVQDRAPLIWKVATTGLVAKWLPDALTFIRVHLPW